MTEVSIVIERLREIGYSVSLKENGNIRLFWHCETSPGPEAASLIQQLRRHKSEAVALLRQEKTDPEPPARDPFKAEPLPPNLITCLPCRSHPHCWVARRAGTLEPAGHGPDQVEAILALDKAEAAQRHKHKRQNAGRPAS